MFLLEKGGIILSNEAIEHVKEAEATVQRIRQDADEKIATIQSDKEAQLEQIEQELEGELRTFKETA